MRPLVRNSVIPCEIEEAVGRAIFTLFLPLYEKDQRSMTKVQKAVWAEEKAEVEVLLAQRDEHVNIGRRLKTLQASVEGGGRTVRDGMGQVHSNTNQHQIKIHSMLSSNESRWEWWLTYR